MLKGLRQNFFIGLIVIIPAIVTFWLVSLLIVPFNVLFLEPVMKFIEPRIQIFVPDYAVKIALFVVIMLFIAFIGFGTRVLFLKKFFSFLEKKFCQVPLAGKIYSATKEVSHVFLKEEKRAFTRVILIEFPRKGIYSLGFVTSENDRQIRSADEKKLINVFVASSPNPASGFLFLVPEEEIIPLDMTIEEGFKLVISGGILPLPDKVCAKKTGGQTRSLE